MVEPVDYIVLASYATLLSSVPDVACIVFSEYAALWGSDFTLCCKICLFVS